MFYYYAHTGHKVGLDRARRGLCVVNALREVGVDATLLANDFRAGVAMKELGLRDYITVETILDVDFIAKEEDAVIVDSPEDDKGKHEIYAEKFAFYARFANVNEVPVADEVLFKEDCDDEHCLSSVIVDRVYFESVPKNGNTLFYFGDADYDKTILQNADFFKHFEMDLLWGHYFFVKYEEEMMKLFKNIEESENYVDAIKSAETVVTCSSQCALEAKAAGCKVVYIAQETSPLYTTRTLALYGVFVVETFDSAEVERCLHAPDPETIRTLRPFDGGKLIEKIKSKA
jgi:hypothetical protein